MIQRIQSVYLFLSMLFLSVLLSGIAIVSFSNGESESVFSIFGLFRLDRESGFLHPDMAFPYYFFVILLILFHALTLFRFKKLKSQLKLAQYTFLVYVILGLALLIFALVGNEMALEGSTMKPASGLFLFLGGIPFTFLAVRSIKKDKSSVDSIDRIR